MSIPVGQYTSVGYGKETTFATGVTPTVFPGAETFSPVPKNMPIQRPDSRNRSGRSYPATGPYDFTASLRPSPQPDTLFPLLAWALGAQTVPAAAVYTASALTSGSTAGAGTVLAVTINTGLAFQIGDSVILGAGTANVETVVVTAHAASTVTATTTKTHALGDTLQGVSPTAFSSVASFGTSLPSFTLEFVRNTGKADDYFGCMIDTLKLSLAPGGELQADFGLCAATELINNSPTAASFSALFPIVSETAPLIAPAVSFNAVALGFGTTTIVKKWDISLANKLDKTFRSPGSRIVSGFPLGQREVSGSIVLSFPDDSKYQAFLGAAAATSPQSAITGIALALASASQSFADATRFVPWQLGLALPNCFLEGDAVPDKVSGALEQTLTFSAYETAGQNNDLTATLTGTSSTVY